MFALIYSSLPARNTFPRFLIPAFVSYLFRLLLASSLTLEVAVKSLSQYDPEQVVEFIRRKLDVQELVMDEQGKLCLP